MAATLPNVMLQFGSETALNCQIGMAENNKEVNTALEEDPGLINSSAEEAGWLCKMSGVSEGDLGDLMTEAEYEEFVNGLK